jgi:hypothetical protein
MTKKRVLGIITRYRLLADVRVLYYFELFARHASQPLGRCRNCMSHVTPSLAETTCRLYVPKCGCCSIPRNFGRNFPLVPGRSQAEHLISANLSQVTGLAEQFGMVHKL